MSLNRQEAEIAAERFALSQDVEGFWRRMGAAFHRAGGRASIKTAHGISAHRHPAAYRHLQRRSLILSAQVTATLAACWLGLASGWTLADSVLGNAVWRLG